MTGLDTIQTPSTSKVQKSQNIFLFFLYLLAFSLPLTEFVKQVAIVGLIFSGGYLFYLQERSIKKDLSFIGVTLLAGASFIAIPFAQDPSGALHGALDIFKVVAIFIILRGLSLDYQTIGRFFIVLFISFIIAVIWGGYNYFIEEYRYFELHSIGHVNHSAIYTGMLILIAYGIFFLKNFTPNLKEQKILTILSLFTLLIGIFALVVEGSRAGLLGTFIPLLLTFFITKGYKNKKLLYLLGIIIIISLITLFNNKYAFDKVQEGIFYSANRTSIWLGALKSFPDQNIFHMLFGMGAKNFHFINLQHYVPDFATIHKGHAHNTYITFLLEKGIVGLLGYLIFLLGVFKDLWQSNKTNLLKIIALNIFLLNLIISLVNTTFHDELSLLMVIVWALAIQKRD